MLDVSRVASGEDQRSLPLVLDNVTVAARAIEERLFRDCFRCAWTIAALPSDNEPAMLLAVDEHYWMLGADRVARDAFGLDDERLASGVPLSAAFEFDPSIFRQNDGRDIPARVVRAGGGETFYALLTPPLGKSRGARSWAEEIVHSRPRISTLGHLPVAEPLGPSRGGLPPVLTRRICEYIESHLDQKVGLEAWLPWLGFQSIISQGHSTNRWECRLTATFWTADWNARSACFGRLSFRCRKLRRRPDSRTRVISRGTSGGGQACRPGGYVGKSGKSNRIK